MGPYRKPSIAPLCMNVKGPEANGGTPLSSAGSPGVALRTAANTAEDRILPAIPAKLLSAHSGDPERYTAGSSPLHGAYHPTPNPSAFTTPLIISSGA